GVAQQAGAHLGCWPRGGYRVPARLASGPANQPIGIVAAVELTSCKVPGRHERGAGAAGTTTVGAGQGRDGRRPGRGSGPWQAADFEQLEPERLDLREHAIQRGAVGQRPGQHGVAAAGPGLQGRERGAYRLAQAAADTDPVPVGRPVGAGTGHVLTTHAVNRPAVGSTVIGTCTGDPSCLSGSSPRATARPVSGRRTIEVISGTISAPGWQTCPGPERGG